MIGDQWLQLTDDQGRRRIEDLCDYVRIEIESALKRDIPVVPVRNELSRRGCSTQRFHGQQRRPELVHRIEEHDHLPLQYLSWRCQVPNTIHILFDAIFCCLRPVSEFTCTFSYSSGHTYPNAYGNNDTYAESKSYTGTKPRPTPHPRP